MWQANRMEPNPNPKRKSSSLTDYARYSGLAFQMLGSILLCVYLGYRFDKWVQWDFPAGIIAGVFIGLFAAIYPVVKSTGNKN